MATEDPTDEPTGKEFRAKFEALQAQNKTLRQTVAQSVAQTFKYVKPEDLLELEPDQIAAKAQEIETTRTTEAEALVKKFLAERGVPAEELDTALSKLNQPKETETVEGDDEVAARVASLGSLGGTPITPKADPSLTGEDRIRAALNAKGPKTQLV